MGYLYENDRYAYIMYQIDVEKKPLNTTDIDRLRRFDLDKFSFEYFYIDWSISPRKRIQSFTSRSVIMRLHQSISKLCPMSYAMTKISSQSQIIIYQRDKSRKLLNVLEFSQFIQQKVKKYSVSIMYHSNLRSTCELLSVINTRGVILITVHGFQSVLHIFQPLYSGLIEVFPAYFSKPNLFGYIQQGISQHVGFNRPYHYIDVKPTASSIKFIDLLGIISPHDCLHTTICRYLAKNQNVVLNTTDMQLIVDYILAFNSSMIRHI